MKSKDMEVVFVCEKCGNNNQEELIDDSESNKNWNVSKRKCPKCNGKIKLDFYGDLKIKQ